jgi:xanthine/uracil/vitamin C permease (AzgA family)
VCPTSDLCVDDDIYLQCVAEINRDLITTTAAIAALASFLMGLLANLPVGMAPGLGLNAYVRFHDFSTSGHLIGVSSVLVCSSHIQSLVSTVRVSSHTVKHLLLFSWKGQ